MGPEIQLAPGNAWWNEAAYNPATDQYLVLWIKLGGAVPLLQARCIDAGTGQFAGPEFTVGSNISLGRPVYIPQRPDEWFIVFHTDADIGGDIKAQRITANGTVGSQITLVQVAGNQQLPAADYDPVRQRLLVAWADHQPGSTTIRGRFFDVDGVPLPGHAILQLGEETPRWQNNPTVAFNPATDEFLVAWADMRNDVYRTNPNENNNNYCDIYGQRVSAATGLPIGPDIPILSPFVPGQPYVGDGQDVPCPLVCNTNAASAMFGTFFLPDQELTAGFGFTMRGLILDAQGSRYNGMQPFNISHPLRGGYTGGVYSPVDDVYITSFLDSDYDLSARVFSTGGELLAGGKIIAHPDYEENFGALAIRPSDGQCLQTTIKYEHFASGTRPHALLAQRFIRDAAPPGSVTGFSAAAGPRLVHLTWTNPPDADFSGTMIRFSTSSPPATPADGTLLVDVPAAPGAAGVYTHAGLAPGITYYYAAFAHDDLANFASPSVAQAVPAGLGDFEPDGDVDQSDYGVLQRCFSGDGVNYAPGCDAADFDLDGDVDTGDLNLFLPCVSGADRPSGC